VLESPGRPSGQDLVAKRVLLGRCVIVGVVTVIVQAGSTLVR
jgi:hypothetical protein